MTDEMPFPEFETVARFLALGTGDDAYGDKPVQNRFKVERRHHNNTERIILSEYSQGHYSKLEEWDVTSPGSHPDILTRITEEAKARLPFYLDTELDWDVET